MQKVDFGTVRIDFNLVDLETFCKNEELMQPNELVSKFVAKALYLKTYPAYLQPRELAAQCPGEPAA